MFKEHLWARGYLETHEPLRELTPNTVSGITFMCSIVVPCFTMSMLIYLYGFSHQKCLKDGELQQKHEKIFAEA